LRIACDYRRQATQNQHAREEELESLWIARHFFFIQGGSQALFQAAPSTQILIPSNRF
jgi:hypothetical protein